METLVQGFFQCRFVFIFLAHQHRDDGRADFFCGERVLYPPQFSAAGSTVGQFFHPADFSDLSRLSGSLVVLWDFFCKPLPDEFHELGMVAADADALFFGS